MINTIKKYAKLLTFITLPLYGGVGEGLFASCNKEEVLTPSGADHNIFATAGSDEESVLRQSFFDQTGVYLAFSDSLSETDRIDLGYSLKSNTGYDYDMDKFETIAEKKNAAEFARTQMLPHLGDGMRPYSLLLTKQLRHYDKTESKPKWANDSYIQCWNCLALSLNGIEDMNDSLKQDFMGQIFYNIISSKISAESSSFFENFYAVSETWTNENKSQFDIPNEYDDDQARKFGFLKDYYKRYYPSRSTDRNDYFKAALTMTETDFRKKYADYPLCLKKYEWVKGVLEGWGYVF